MSCNLNMIKKLIKYPIYGIQYALITGFYKNIILPIFANNN